MGGTCRECSFLLLLLFLGLFVRGFNRVIGYEDGIKRITFQFWLLLGVAGILLAMFPLFSLVVDMFDINGTPRPFRGQDVLFFDLCAIVAIAVTIAIQYAWRPFSFVHVILADYLSGYYFFTALVLALLVFLVRRIL